MEQQIEQLLKEVKGNETLERLVKMNRNPNELFIERIRTMNKGEGNATIVKGYKLDENDIKYINVMLNTIHTNMKNSINKLLNQNE